MLCRKLVERRDYDILTLTELQLAPAEYREFISSAVIAEVAAEQLFVDALLEHADVQGVLAEVLHNPRVSKGEKHYWFAER